MSQPRSRGGVAVGLPGSLLVAAGQQACCQSFESVDLRPEIQILAPDRLVSGWPLSRLLGCPCGFPLGCRLRRATQRIEHTFDYGTTPSARQVAISAEINRSSIPCRYGPLPLLRRYASAGYGHFGRRLAVCRIASRRTYRTQLHVRRRAAVRESRC